MGLFDNPLFPSVTKEDPVPPPGSGNAVGSPSPAAPAEGLFNGGLFSTGTLFSTSSQANPDLFSAPLFPEITPGPQRSTLFGGIASPLLISPPLISPPLARDPLSFGSSGGKVVQETALKPPCAPVKSSSPSPVLTSTPAKPLSSAPSRAVGSVRVPIVCHRLHLAEDLWRKQDDQVKVIMKAIKEMKGLEEGLVPGSSIPVDPFSDLRVALFAFDHLIQKEEKLFETASNIKTNMRRNLAPILADVIMNEPRRELELWFTLWSMSEDILSDEDRLAIQ